MLVLFEILVYFYPTQDPHIELHPSVPIQHHIRHLFLWLLLWLKVLPLLQLLDV
jgi:hypothetical protein